jgi:transposase
VAEDHAGQRRLGCSQDQGHLPAGAVQRLRARRGAKKAIIAVAASMLTAAFHILRESVPYKDLGPEHFTRRDKKHAARRLQRRLEDLGFAVEIRPTTSGVSI